MISLKIDDSIVLKQLEKSDATDIYATINSQRSYLGKWLPFVQYTKKIADTQNFVNSIVDAPKNKFEYVFTIQYNNTFVGLISFKNTSRKLSETEIGYWLSSKFQKKGIITKSVNALTKFAFEELKLNKILIKCAVGNIPSKKIPQHLNFTFEGTEKKAELLSNNNYVDLEVYSKLK
ncbi:GCN5 family acetyltransferase [Tenacibaculum holothuriorum]|uniref:GCN5 family acetyltransferase n=1 Tax=Tenacibaculum holothuriorum TaxID=1635173 RepID=A0A1Y2PB29_9FLAO|nr:GNAT family protein [Tenacibaculum holothuriorum]OSY86928.1 GCN5 family acetyltransferase [Tenacibaculum holothuriorum]